MRKQIIILVGLVVLLLTACGGVHRTWQEQYDLGIRYLSEGNYEEAIIAFTAAIEIDPNQTLAYVGRGNAYFASGETEEKLAAAQADYEKAIELDETLAEAYWGLVQIYEKSEDIQALLALLRQGIEKAPSVHLTEMFNRYQNDSFYNSDTFFPFSSIDEGARNTLLESLRILQNGNIDGTTLLRSKDDFQKLTVLDSAYSDRIQGELRTTVDGSKVQVRFYYSPSSARTSTGEPIIRTSISLEIRPKIGAGYYYEFQEDNYQYSGKTSQHIGYTTGECDNWNWNGAFEHTWIRDDKVVRSAGTLADGLLEGEAYYEEIYPYPEYPEITKVVNYCTYSGGKPVLTRDERFPDRWDMGYIVTIYANGEEDRIGAVTDNPDKWKDWCSNYQTGADSSVTLPEYELLWN